MDDEQPASGIDDTRNACRAGATDGRQAAGQEEKEGRQESREGSGSEEGRQENYQESGQESRQKILGEEVRQKGRQESAPRRKRRPRSRSADSAPDLSASLGAEAINFLTRQSGAFRWLPDDRQARAPPVDQKHCGGAGQHADGSDGIEPLSEQHIGHQRGHRRHQIEQARDRSRGLAPDQPVQQPDRPDREHDRQPGQCQHEFLGPVHGIVLEQPAPMPKKTVTAIY